MRVEIPRGAVSFLSAGRVFEDDEKVRLSLLEDRIDAECLSVELEHQRSGCDLVARHTEDVGDRDFSGGFVGLEVRRHSKCGIVRKVLEAFEILSPFAAGVLDAN